MQLYKTALFVVLMDIKMSTIVGTLTFVNMINLAFMSTKEFMLILWLCMKKSLNIYFIV